MSIGLTYLLISKPMNDTNTKHRNPHSLRPGQKAILDNEDRARCTVTIINMTSNKLISTVEYGNEKWSIMTDRLTPFV